MRHRINSPSVISESIDGEVVAINLLTGTYYSLQGTAARVWDATAAGLTVDEVVADLTTAYDTDGADIAASVTELLDRLVAETLLVPGEAPPDPQPLAAAGAPQPWHSPQLEVFTDMQDLILLDPVHEVEPEQGWPAARETTNG
jgi:Coenzyme PQQ synthesis protein D (PqqD)